VSRNATAAWILAIVISALTTLGLYLSARKNNAQPSRLPLNDAQAELAMRCWDDEMWDVRIHWSDDDQRQHLEIECYYTGSPR